MKYHTITYRRGLGGSLLVVILLGILIIGPNMISKNTSENQIEILEQKEAVPQKTMIEAVKIRVHIVQDGDTLGEIAEKYGVDMDTLRSGNENLSIDIHQGDPLIILPGKGALHITEVGDTFWSIGQDYGVDMAVVIKANGKDSEELSIGEKIFVPGGRKIQRNERVLARGETAVSRAGNQRFVYPTRGELTSAFGYRWGRSHNGIDLANDVGTPITSARSGRVVHAGWYSGYGYTVIMEHDQGYTTLYGHLDEYLVQIGQYVKEGQVIAYMGNTGNSTGPHLHFEVWKNGTPINPYNVLPN